jgi:hypothetical protein
MSEFQGPTGFAPWPGSGNNHASIPANNTNINGTEDSRGGFGNPVPYRQQQQPVSRHRTDQPTSHHAREQQPGPRPKAEQPGGTHHGVQLQPPGARPRPELHQQDARTGSELACRSNPRRRRPDLYRPKVEREEGEVEMEWEHDRFRP